MHFVIAAVITALPGGGIDYKIAGHGFGGNLVLHVSALQLERPMDGMQDVA
jgi:thioesterase domain-containing protein